MSGKTAGKPGRVLLILGAIDLGLMLAFLAYRYWIERLYWPSRPAIFSITASELLTERVITYLVAIEIQTLTVGVGILSASVCLWPDKVNHSPAKRNAKLALAFSIVVALLSTAVPVILH